MWAWRGHSSSSATGDSRLDRRYSVDGLSALTGALRYGGRNYLRTRLTSLGNGGCGFYVDFDWDRGGIFDRLRAPFDLKSGKEVEILLRADIIYPKELRLKGSVRYATKLAEDDPLCPWYVGVEFDEESLDLIPPLTDYLELLSLQGIIEFE